MLDKATYQAVTEHALKEYPKECCGLLIDLNGKTSYYPCRNLAIESSDHFKIGAEDRADAEDIGDVLAVIHSHPDYPAEPSVSDRVSCEASGLPWIIVSVTEDSVGAVHYMSPSGYEAPLVGRPFFHGVLDCYSIVRDWYSRVKGVELINKSRDNLWWERDEDLYMDNYQSAGFRKLGPDEDMKVGDVILMQVMSDKANHAAVYVDDSIVEGTFAAKGSILHHLYGRLSERTVYGGYWKDVTVGVFRYEQQQST